MVKVESVDISSYEDLLIQLHVDHFGFRADETPFYKRRFTWLYQKNPAGKACVWIARNDEKEEIIGKGAAFPRDIRIGGKNINVWSLGDNSVSKNYRTLGPAVQLRKAPLAVVEAGKVPFYYALPNEVAFKQHERVGSKRIGEYCWYAKLLNVGSKTKIVRIMYFILLMVEPVLYFKSKYFCETKEVGVFDGEYEKFYFNHSSDYKISTVRTSEYLNWRFGQDPGRKYQCFVLRERGGEMKGYVIFSLFEDKSAKVFDLFCEKQGKILRALVANLSLALKKQGILSLSFFLLDKNKWLIQNLSLLGFIRRETNRKHFLVAYCRDDSEYREIIMNGENWHIYPADFN